MSTPALYDLASQLYHLEPWEELEEIDLIRIVHPSTGEIGHISIMGSHGEHRALALYIGYEALGRFNLMQDDDPFDPAFPELDRMSLLFETRQVQLSFGRRDELHSYELAAINKTGKKYRGDNWPMFRSFKPGYVPGALDDADIFWLTTAIEQFLVVFPQLESEGPCLTTFRIEHDACDILTRSFKNGVWHTTWTEHEDFSYEWATPSPSEFLIEKIKRQQRLVDIDCHFQILPTPIGSAGSATFPYLAISVEPKSGFILGMELLSVENQTFKELVASVPDIFLRQWDKACIRPASIRVKTITTYSMLEIAAEDLNTPIRRFPSLPSIDRVMSELPI